MSSSCSLSLSLSLSLLTMQCLQSRTYSLVHMSVISRSVNLCFFGILGWECFHHHSNSLKFPDTFLKHFWELPYKLCKHDKKKNHGKYQKIVDYACVFSSAIYLQWWLLSSREAQMGLPCLLSTHLISYLLTCPLGLVSEQPFFLLLVKICQNVMHSIQRHCKTNLGQLRLNLSWWQVPPLQLPQLRYPKPLGHHYLSP
jgi:hypothetical protein